MNNTGFLDSLVNLLFSLIGFGFNSMSSTDKEVAALGLRKVEERIQQVRRLSVNAI